MTSASRVLRPAVLLDRDGTLIVEKNYLADPTGVELEEGVVEGLTQLQRAGYRLVVVTNQSGIGRGYYTLSDAQAVNQRVAELLAARGVLIDGWYICPHRPDADCDCRKPRPGLALAAAKDLSLDLAHSWVIGDKASDVELAAAFDGRGLLVATGEGAAGRGHETQAVESLEVAARRIIRDDHGPRLLDLAERAESWLRTKALPLWSSAGFDPAAGQFEEALGFDGLPLRDRPRRLMVQARQISVYASAGLDGLCATGVQLAVEAGRRMVASFLEADGQPGWVFSIDRTGRVVDPGRDLYAHAFVLFALAWLRRVDASPLWREATAKTLAFLQSDFADRQRGGYWDQLPRRSGPRHQNPHMHLFEALIAQAAIDKDTAVIARAAELDVLGREWFLDSANMALREQFHDDWRVFPDLGHGSVEPGHQMEWAWLWGEYGQLTGLDRNGTSRALVDRALLTGVDPTTGRIVDQCDEAGQVTKASSRSWPHAEAAKALAQRIAAGELGYVPVYCAIVERLLSRYCEGPVPGGWIDQFNEADVPVSTFMPTSSLYHLYFGLRTLDRLAPVFRR